ncbi:histidine triad family protein [Vibrio mimicus VM223]|nr:histidine triad family protein [Vibrio mimicus VM223]
MPQLHIHHIARFTHDMAWPGPVWGRTQGVFRSEQEQKQLLSSIQDHLAQNPLFALQVA